MSAIDILLTVGVFASAAKGRIATDIILASSSFAADTRTYTHSYTYTATYTQE